MRKAQSRQRPGFTSQHHIEQGCSVSKSDSIERIQPCPSFPGYSASSNGEIFSHWNRTGHGTGNGSSTWIDAGFSKKLKQRPNAGGYPVVSCNTTSGGKQLVHTMVADAFIGPKPMGLEVRHLDGNPSNSAKSNLAYGTSKENSADMVFHGTQRSGQLHQCAKFTDEQIREVYRRVISGEPRKNICASMKISKGMVSVIVNGKHRQDAFAAVSKQIAEGTNVPMFSV